MSSRLRVVIDTNVLLVSSYSKHHWLFKLMIGKRIEVCITTEILSEYEEVLGKHLSEETSKSVIKLLLELDNVNQTNIYYKYDLIKANADDNKFVDCYLAANCDYLTTNHKHFNILKQLDFPIINFLKLEEFKEIANRN